MRTNKNVTTMSETERLKAELAKALAENEALKAAKIKARPFSMKVSEKGAVSAYGLGRFPVTLYGEQWEVLLAHAAEIKQFLADNRNRLSTKADKVSA